MFLVRDGWFVWSIKALGSLRALVSLGFSCGGCSMPLQAADPGSLTPPQADLPTRGSLRHRQLAPYAPLEARPQRGRLPPILWSNALRRFCLRSG